MEPIIRYGINLRLVEEKDAQFIVSLRTNSLLNQYISPTSSNISDQTKWLQNYKLREQEGSEFYFIAEDLAGNNYGTTRLYNFDEKSFEVGSWLFMSESPSGMAIKADIICREIGFELLDAEYCRFEVRKENKCVLRYHRGYSPTKVNEDDQNLYFNLSKENFYSQKKKLLKFI